MKFSIITATYNAADLIEKTIESVLQQNSNGVIAEHIIIDSASDDGTVNILERYSKKYPNIVRYISEPDNGIYDALNKGLKLAKGDYVNIQGAGDALNDNVLQYVDMNADKKDFVYGRIYMQDSKRMFGQNADAAVVAYENICHQGIFYSARIYKNYQYNLKYRVYADWEYNIRLFADESITKKYLDVTIGFYEGNGISFIGMDDTFAQDKAHIIQKKLGEEYYKWYVESGSAAYFYQRHYFGEILKDGHNNIVNGNELYPIVGMGCSKEFWEYVHSDIKEKIYIFGASKMGENALWYVNNISQENITVLAFVDNSSEKWGTIINKLLVISPDEIDINKAERIIIASMWHQDIKRQLLDMGIDEERIIIS